MNDKTVEIIRTDYLGQPKRVAQAIVEMAITIHQPESILTGPHSRLIGSIGLCQDSKADPMVCMLEIVESIIGSFLRNPKQLVKLVEEIELYSKRQGLGSNRYIDLAKTYIQEVYLSSRGIAMKLTRQEDLIRKIKLDLQENHRIAEENSEILSNLRSSLNENNQVDAHQSRQISDLESEVERQRSIDKQQMELLQNLDDSIQEKDALDERQSKLIDEIRKEFAAQQEIDAGQSHLLQQIEEHLEKKNILDDKQTKTLLKLKEELIEKTIQDLEQTHAIDHLEVYVQNLQNQIVDLQKKLGTANQFAIQRDHKLRLHKRLIIFGGVVLFVIQLVTIAMVLIK